MSNTVWVIYDHPSDYPNHYVARKWVVDAPGVARNRRGHHQAKPARDGAELCLRGFFPFPRYELDDPKIVETWL